MEGRFRITETENKRLRFIAPNGDSIILTRKEIQIIRDVCNTWLGDVEKEGKSD